jgi:hypothetical protein
MHSGTHTLSSKAKVWLNYQLTSWEENGSTKEQNI